MKWFLPVLLILLIGCGGGGGGGTGATVRVTGRVLTVETGGPLNPAPSVQVGGSSVRAEAGDGSFALDAPAGATQVLVDTLGPFGVFTFTVPALTAGTDVGDLWVGPARVAVVGSVRNSTTGEPVMQAQVSFGGRTALTAADGSFRLADVAYSAANPDGLLAIEGAVRRTGFFATTFAVQDPVAVGGEVFAGDLVLTPSDDDDPPPTPFNLFGRVSPIAEAPGTVVTLLQGGTPVRTFTVGPDSRYFFWVPSGTYDLRFRKGALAADVNGVNLATNDSVVQRDVTLR
jgi:hypothetical protein